MDTKILLLVFAGCILATVTGDGHESVCEALLEECTRVYAGQIHTENDKQYYKDCVEVIDCSDDPEGEQMQDEILQSIEDMVVHEHASGSSVAQFSMVALLVGLFLTLRR